MCRNAAPGIRMISQLVAGVTARRVRGSDRSNSLNTPSIWPMASRYRDIGDRGRDRRRGQELVIFIPPA
jgi:hypothetical protein